MDWFNNLPPEYFEQQELELEVETIMDNTKDSKEKQVERKTVEEGTDEQPEQPAVEITEED